METEVRSLKQELTRTREALKLATKRCRDLVRELDSRTAGHESERCLRDQQLSRILRALLVLESRLKQEQKSIRQLLCEKDNVIRNQQLEIARLRRYTKNYIKSKREQNRSAPQQRENDELSSLSSSNLEEVSRPGKPLASGRDPRVPDDEAAIDEMSNELGSDIERLKHEIIDKLRRKDLEESEAETPTLESPDARPGHRQIPACCVRKTNSFAGSDVSKESCASSSENTDAGSILTTTTDESSPSLLSTEGFCEGESTDCSPGSTLSKPTSKSFPNSRKTDDNDSRVLGPSKTIDTVADDAGENDRETDPAGRRYGVLRAEPLEILFQDEHTKATITRAESKDDGMDCNFASDDENLEDIHEPIYVNACNENNAKNLRDSQRKILSGGSEENYEDYHFDNNNGPSKLDKEEGEEGVEETSGNWYSDPDEDRISDDVFRHSTYRPKGNHNSVLECVNQILLRDMEEEESVLTAPRRFKHRGRIVRFQPARLSDIESVGSEMERRNSEDCPNEREAGGEGESGNFEGTGSEDEFGMRLEEGRDSRSEGKRIEAVKEESEAAIPIVVIEPKSTEAIETPVRVASACLEMGNPRGRSINGSASPTLRMERIEEKTCLQMSSKGLTIAKNLDYEDIESLPEVMSPRPKTPPALPPKPTQFRSTLVLKKIPSPSFLIDETRRKNPQRKIDAETRRGISGCLPSPAKTPSNGQTSRSLVFEEKYSVPRNQESSNDSHEKTRFASSRSAFQTINESPRSSDLDNLTPRVTSMVRHFEEFKIGGDDERKISREHRERSRDRSRHNDYEQFDIRQNFEEFNLDECDLSDDPDRPEADGSERLSNLGICQIANDRSNADNNNVIYTSTCLPNTSNNANNGIYDNFLEATGLSNKSILTPSRLLSNHKSMLKPKDVKYKNKIKANAGLEKNPTGTTHFTQVRHWTGPFV
ncbi:uncharacterized protein [Venturia canescens]|nr:uncharacterized protein LOC122410600 isoform X2 [Venturia canescens]XP_043274793.1 uncharacterized protein LOC122410600 isoform X2 [Venturia canescens]XP_043274794.1 uncharacterized protein LOC122410600 isoform X2 [Venturia canescens]XP_043274795.1 uncharacterized protein LOC122410600 isoform X2 [Venturia canescens]